MKKAMLVTAIVAMALGVNAGDWGKAPVGKAPIEECVDLGGQISAGYMTDFIFYGVRFAGDSVWTDVNYTIEGLPLPITVGAWYLNSISEDSRGGARGGGFDQLDLYARAALGTFAGFDTALGYTHYVFPEFRSNVAPVGGYGELGLNINRSLGFVDLAFESNYAMGGGGSAPSGWYHRLGVEKTFGLTDSISLVVGTGVGYSDGYFAVGGLVPNTFSPRSSGWNHYDVRVSLPIELNCRTTLTPYIGYNGSPDTFITDGIAGSNENQTDILLGGVSLSVGF